MPAPPSFQQAELAIDGGATLRCAFNPSSYSVTKTNIWTYKPKTGTDLPDAEFGGGLPRVAKIQLLLDASLLGEDESVKDQANELLKMMETGGGGPAPPFVTFSWGQNSLPKSAPVALNIQYILFRPNGDPMRALVDIELAQAEKDSTASSGTGNSPTNPHTYSQQGLRSHRVRDGDSLPSIAYDYYGDATEWRVIAQANGIDNPLRLRRSAELTIPPLD